MRALLIPVEGDCRVVDLPAEGGLDQMQTLVGGYVEAVAVPEFVPGSDRATAYVNEEGKILGLPINRRATDFMVPGAGMLFGDYVAGPFLLCGFDPATGAHADLPAEVEARAELIEREAGR